MRILDRSKISYEYQTYECDNFTVEESFTDRRFYDRFYMHTIPPLLRTLTAPIAGSITESIVFAISFFASMIPQ